MDSPRLPLFVVETKLETRKGHPLKTIFRTAISFPRAPWVLLLVCCLVNSPLAAYAEIFEGIYQHSKQGQAYSDPIKLRRETGPDGSLTISAVTKGETGSDFAATLNKDGVPTEYAVISDAGELRLVFGDGKVSILKRNLQGAASAKEAAIPAGAQFDPNSRPDPYAMAPTLFRRLGFKTAGETKEVEAFDLDLAQESMAVYRLKIEFRGKETVTVPAGMFEANHFVVTQLTDADTWFKKRIGNITDFWVLDNYVVVRVLRHREPYEIQLASWNRSLPLPGFLRDAPQEAAGTQPAAKNAAGSDAPKNVPIDYGSELNAFLTEIDATYPFFDLKGIRDDWTKTKADLVEKIKACTSNTQFLGIVLEAIAALRDSHMSLCDTKESLPEREAEYYPGISFMPATEGRVVVMASLEKYGAAFPTGTVVKEIDGKDARQFLEDQVPQAWAKGFSSSPQRARIFVYRIPLKGKMGDTHTITYLRDGAEQTATVTCSIEARGWPHNYNQPAGLSRVGRSVAYGKLAGGAGYIYLRRIDNETEGGIRQALEAYPDAKGWIIDLCGNGGGGYDSVLVERIKAIPKPVAVIIDAGCMSAGETLARDLAKYVGARLFGSKTAGASSEKRRWTFPSGIASVVIPIRSHGGNDRSPIEFNGIAPDEEVEAVPEEVAQGINSAIRRAEQYLATGK